MILQEIIIEEAGLQKDKSREQILNLINSQINQHKLQYWSEWEGNHNLSFTLDKYQSKAGFE